jgi:NADH-quinone oxidoreductase subunit J
MLILFYILAISMIVSALAVVFNRNPLFGALCLILNMIGIACMFAMLQAHFLAVTQMIVYAGAVMVLVLFVLMLLNVKVEQIKLGTLILGSVSALGCVVFLYFMLPYIANAFKPLTDKINGTQIVAVAEGTVASIGQLLFSKYVFTFEVASLLIMAALVGAVMLGSRTIHKRY